MNDLLKFNSSFDPMLNVETHRYQYASWKYEKLMEQINSFQSNLSDDLDVCVALASFGSSTIMQVAEIGYQNPDILYFYGKIGGNDAQLIQHTSQLNFLLMATKKDEPTRPPRRIGFALNEEEN